jgi:hypothetical protein
MLGRVVRTGVSEALVSSETSVLTRSTLRNIPEDGILHCHRRENLNSYCLLWAVTTSTAMNTWLDRSNVYSNFTVTWRQLDSE